jgi:glutaminase
VDPISRVLAEVHEELLDLTDGALATYIPQLAAADPGRSGLAVAGVSGRVYQVGDAGCFTVQSVSKPFVFALALAESGVDAVLARVGVEPSGDGFNAISLEPGTGRPLNPLINAGAILTTSLIAATEPAERFGRILAGLSGFAGRPLQVDHATWASERATGDRNRALAYLMRSAGALTASPEEATDVYFRQCSVLVTTADLAVMAATLAGGGVNPLTGHRVVGEREAALTLTVMVTCGMYDYSGRWLVRAGLPAKSGVSGCLIAASPGQFGIGAFSPPLDEQGNSVRAVAAVERLSAEFELDLVRHPGLTAPVIARRSTCGPDGALTTAVVLALQGELDFAAAEEVLSEILALRDRGLTGLLIDTTGVSRIRHVAARLLAAALADADAAGGPAAVAGPWARELPGVRAFERLAEAQAWCAAHRTARSPGTGEGGEVRRA